MFSSPESCLPSVVSLYSNARTWQEESLTRRVTHELSMVREEEAVATRKLAEIMDENIQNKTTVQDLRAKLKTVCGRTLVRDLSARVNSYRRSIRIHRNDY